ncbi:MAG: phosphoglycolate phosphatase [Variovorax sp.]
MNLRRFDAAIIDLDGTLIDTLDDFLAALNAMADELALPRIEADAVRRRVGKGSEHLVRSVLEQMLTVGDASATDADVAVRFDGAFASYQRNYLAVNGRHARVYPGVTEGLDALRDAGLRLACLTNKPTAFALPLLEQKSLAGYFEQVFGGDAFERKKPDPLPLIKTCEALGSTPARTLMIGDSSNDARAARAAGCPVLLVSYGYNHGQPVSEVDCDGVLGSLGELAQLDELADAPRENNRGGQEERSP